ncbi:unnamed protein product [Leptosia nina]|uniref:Thyroid transcription factor 1-associated protein 26 n=1 Tax=Leptosia nina TaxID=320188 RepID=A0AAV1J350_9NEOP
MEKKRDSFFLSNKKQKPKDKKFQNKDGEPAQKKKKESNDVNDVGPSEPSENGKKPFDKKTYRLKKYSKKYKLEQWEEQRKKRLLNEYQKSVKNDPMAGTYKPISFDEDTTDSTEVGRFVKHPDLLEKLNQKPKKAPFERAKDKFNKVKEERLQKQEAKEKAREERMKKLQEYKKKKQERFKKLSKKNKKGQPVMAGRMELLLDKIKSSK